MNDKPTVQLRSLPEGISYALVDLPDQPRSYWRTANPARCRAEMLAYAAAHRRTAESELAKAAAFEAGAAEVVAMIPHAELVTDTREQVLGRLRWCEHFFGRKHLRNDTWPEDRRAEFELVREIVERCDDLDALVRWSVICERMAFGWVDALATDVLRWPPMDTSLAEQIEAELRRLTGSRIELTNDRTTHHGEVDVLDRWLERETGGRDICGARCVASQLLAGLRSLPDGAAIGTGETAEPGTVWGAIEAAGAGG